MLRFSICISLQGNADLTVHMCTIGDLVYDVLELGLHNNATTVQALVTR